MARPTKWRRIEHIPSISCFLPAGTSPGDVPELTLKLEELEALRLKDLLGLEQAECAAKMGVSRPTFQRILIAAREKVADCLVHGKAINIEGGNYTLNICPVKCLACGQEWMESYENLEAIKQGTYTCTSCGSVELRCVQSQRGKFCRRHCHRHGRGNR